MEVIKLEEMELPTIENTNILTTFDIVDEKSIASSPLLKQNHDVGHYYRKNEFTIDCKEEELANYSGSDKGAQLSQSHGKLFTCDICEKAFKQRSHLNRHKLIHSGEKQ